MRQSNLQAFISYSRADWRDVEDLARELRYAGIATWLDTENIRPGDEWEATIRSAIRSSRAFVFCISRFSLQSRRTPAELASAIEHGLLLFPVMIEPTPIETLPDVLKQRHILQLFRDPPSIALKRAAKELARLLGVIVPGESGFEGSRDTIDVLILRLGDDEAGVSSTCFVNRDMGEDPVIVEKRLAPLDRAQVTTISEWVKRSSLVYIVMGNGAIIDDVALVCGIASTVLGGRRVNLVSTPTNRAVASKLSQLIQARLIEYSQPTGGSGRAISIDSG
jgi:hypothetical protein